MFFCIGIIYFDIVPLIKASNLLIFKQLNEAIKIYYIFAGNIYNQDRKGFIIGFIRIIKYIINIQLLKSGQIKFII